MRALRSLSWFQMRVTGRLPVPVSAALPAPPVAFGCSRTLTSTSSSPLHPVWLEVSGLACLLLLLPPPPPNSASAAAHALLRAFILVFVTKNWLFPTRRFKMLRVGVASSAVLLCRKTVVKSGEN